MHEQKTDRTKKYSKSIIIAGGLGKKYSQQLIENLDQKKVSKYIEVLNNIIKYIDLINIYGTTHLIIAEETLFSSTHRTFTKTGRMLGHKAILNIIKI